MKHLPIWFLLLTSAGACTSRTNVSQAPLLVAPSLRVERFLQAANTRDLETMARLFGADGGPIGDTWRREEVELRMDVLADILQHLDYEIISERRVPEVEVPSVRLGVDMSLPNGITVRDVGFTVVQGLPNRWLVNLIEVVKITGAA